MYCISCVKCLYYLPFSSVHTSFPPYYPILILSHPSHIYQYGHPQENTSDLFKAIKKGKYEYPSPYWDEISAEAKDLIDHILVVDPERRSVN